MGSVRPWGEFLVLGVNPACVKVLVVEPGGQLSLQRHERRGEAWMLVAGEAGALVDGRMFVMRRFAQVWVPMGSWHRLWNPGKVQAVVVETMVGEWDEDDIERSDDAYGRV